MNKQEKVLEYLKNHKKGLSQRDAIEKFQAYRLSSIIFRLKKRGYNIITQMEVSKSEDGSHSNYARYILI